MSAGLGAVGPSDHLLRRGMPTIDGPVPDGARYIDAEKVVQVALNPDDELRNLQVALLYSLTSGRMDERLDWLDPETGHKAVNANWFTIAQWAVLTVGRNMRSADVPHRASLLPGALRRRLTPAILTLRAADDRRVAAALSYGQVMVFVSVYQALLGSSFCDGAKIPEPPVKGDVGPQEDPEPEPDPESDVVPDTKQDTDITIPESKVDVAGLADMVDTFMRDKEIAEEAHAIEDEAQRKTVLELAAQLGAKVGDITVRGDRKVFYETVLARLAKRAGYQTEIAKAFDLYERAAPWERERARQGREPADLIFEANLRIAAVEQAILDQAVTMVVDHLPQHFAEQAEGRLATFAERSLRVPRRIAEMNSKARISSIAAAATDLWARVMTDQVMVVAFPAETIRLGRDIPRRDWRLPFNARPLQKLSDEAQVIFDQFDRSLGDGRGAGAGDWRRFDDRMNFVANLLRSRHDDATLFWQPFTDEDVAKVWQGAYPSRIADPFEQAIRSPSFPGGMDADDYDTTSCDELAPYGQATYQVAQHQGPKEPVL